MSASALENEDLDNVPLVRMEDVQPSRDRVDRTIEIRRPSTDADEDEEVYETCIIDEIDYEKECMIDDDSDSNIGSMVSIKSEEMLDDDEESGPEELIVPEVLDTPIMVEIPAKMKVEVNVVKPRSTWPTLEILPGGVIKKPMKSEVKDDTTGRPTKGQNSNESNKEMMYACAKCSQGFKYLFCLVKHVKWHEEQEKVLMDPHLRTISKCEDTHEITKKTPYKRPEGTEDYICLHSGKKKLVAPAAKPSRRKLPKRLKS